MPIEITLVVRRNQANDNSGFKLTYESTDGSKNLGWFTDAQFVGMYGFHFSLDSDGNQFNKYVIQSVTVKKVAP